VRKGKYVTGLSQRLGNLTPIHSNGKPIIWLHCVSVGEAQAAQSLVRAIANRFPGLAMVISTTTVTGQKVAREIFRDHAVAVFYFPIDWAWTVRRVLRQLQPAAILVMETELWPNLFRHASKRKVPVALLNGRISDKSFGRYKLIGPFIRRVLNDLTVTAVQTDRDAARLAELGMSRDRISVAGNLKFDSAAIPGKQQTPEIRDRYSFRDGRPLIVAASTHEPEERVALDAFQKVKETHSAVRLLIAPRHPERFNEVAALLSNSGFSFVRRSAPSSSDDRNADVVLLDSIGELRSVYALAEVAFVGGSIARHGGQSVIEPAAHGVCTVTGPHTQNFAAVTKALVDENALIQLHESEQPARELAQVLSELLSDEPGRRAIGERARKVCDRNRGATDRTLDLIAPILSATRAEAGTDLNFSPLHAATVK
jgi:3-deoxy-D-manno-octulosonic-acid transferase